MLGTVTSLNTKKSHRLRSVCTAHRFPLEHLIHFISVGWRLAPPILLVKPVAYLFLI